MGCTKESNTSRRVSSREEKEWKRDIEIKNERIKERGIGMRRGGECIED